MTWSPAPLREVARKRLGRSLHVAMLLGRDLFARSASQGCSTGTSWASFGRCWCLEPDRTPKVTPRGAFGQDSAVNYSSIVRARCTRDDRQFSTGSSCLERRNTLLPGVDLYVVGYK
jgi:hypothetical protein